MSFFAVFSAALIVFFLVLLCVWFQSGVILCLMGSVLDERLFYLLFRSRLCLHHLFFYLSECNGDPMSITPEKKHRRHERIRAPQKADTVRPKYRLPISVLAHRKRLTEHFKTHRKTPTGRRGLLKMGSGNAAAADYVKGKDATAFAIRTD